MGKTTGDWTGSSTRPIAAFAPVRILLIFAVLLAAGQVWGAMRKAPYVIYTGVNSQMEVNWQLTTTSVCTFDWGSDSSCSIGSDQTREYGNDHQHWFTIQDLTPGAKYYYRVTAGRQRFAGSFQTAPTEDAADLKFIVYGDARTYPASHDSVANAILSTIRDDSSYQSLVISVGDLTANGNTESYWDSEIFNSAYTHLESLLANLPYQACMGNHEGAGVLFSKYFPYPYIAHHYWSFDYGPAHFAVLDQYTSYGQGSSELNWLTDDLAATTKPWRFVVLHEPGWSAGGGHENNVNVQNYIQPLCEQYHVAVIFGGHNHYYARALVNDVQQITTGGSGAPLYTPDLHYPHVVVARRALHYCKVAIAGDLLRFTATTPSGAVIDTFSMTCPIPNAVGRAAPVPKEFELSQASPNPFNPVTTIRFTLLKNSPVRICILDLSGRKIASLVNGVRPAGSYNVVWDAAGVTSGVYLVRMEAPSFSATKKLTLLK